MGINALGVILATTQTTRKENNMQKQDTIAETMRLFMESGPSVETYPTYKSLNDAVGKVHGKDEGKVQALAGPKAWAWHPDTELGVWRKSTEAEAKAKAEAAASKTHGTRKAKVLSDKDRVELELQIRALEELAYNPHLAPIREELQAKLAADDAARKGTLKDRLAAAVDKLGIARAVELLEEAAEDTE